MQPLYFDGCFGWLHPAQRPDADALGVVICNPLGNDEICSHREMMVLADRIAASGMPAFRFDYRTTGDSNDDAGPESLRAWLDSVRRAVACLRQETGVERVALCGLRLGSALAYLAAQELRDGDAGIAALVMLAPVVSGKTYVRELRAAAAASSLAAFDPLPGPNSELPLNSNGFFWSQAILNDIAAVQLNVASLPAPRVLMLHHQRSKPTQALAAALHDCGAAVDEQGFPGYDGLSYAPFTLAVPDQAFDAVIHWLRQTPSTPRLPACPAVSIASELLLDGVRERPIRFGPSRQLFGILTEPPVQKHDLAVMIVHTGTSHHIGNGRMSVHMARRLARRGIATLRFDPAGLGDSPPVQDELPDGPLYGKQGVSDVSCALDALKPLGYSRGFLFGICAGAYLALHAALTDSRIVATAPANLQRFIWVEGTSLEIAVRQNKRTARSYFRSMMNWAEWKRVLRGEGDPWGVVWILGKRAVAQVWHRIRDLLPAPPGSKLHVVRTWIQGLHDRGTRTLFVYSDDDPGLVEMHAVFGVGGRRLRGTPRAELVMVPDAEHNLNSAAARERFMQMFERWADEVAETPPGA